MIRRSAPSLFVVISYLSLAACSPQQFAKPGVTEQEFRKDAFECRQQVTTMHGGMANTSLAQIPYIRSDIRTCMEARGYRMAEDAPRSSAQPTANAEGW